MKIKKGDTVIIIAGKDRGKTGEVIDAMPHQDRVVVSGVNVLKKHVRKKGNTPGTIVEKPFPVHVSNVQIVDPKQSKPTRVRIERKNGTRVRVAKKSGQTL
jgi:large subunit ribosomal protein L24